MSGNNLDTFDLNGFNSLVEQANESISCDAACMQERERQQLLQQYLDAETNVVNAPEHLITTRKKYITFTQGENGYNEFLDNDLQSKADLFVKTYQSKFDRDVNLILTNIKSFEGFLVNFNNVVDLYKKYKMENNDLEKQLKITTSDTLTNDRKAYYEDEGLNRLRTYYYFFLFIYIIVVVVFILAMFLVKTNVTISKRIFILLLLISYPFVCIWLFRTIRNIFKRGMEYLPKNVYNNL
jgi:hypothetical protein